MMAPPDDVETLYAMQRLGLLSPTDVRSWAESSLTEPVDEDLLRIVVCDADDADCIIRAADILFEECGLKDWTKADVLRIYAAHVSHLIIRGDIEPQAGADLISSATVAYPLADFHDLDAFKYASSEMQDRPEDKAFFEKAILEEAAAWDARRAALRVVLS